MVFLLANIVIKSCTNLYFNGAGLQAGSRLAQGGCAALVLWHGKYQHPIISMQLINPCK